MAATVSSSYPDDEKFSLSLLDLMGLAYQTDRLMADARAMGAIYGTAFRNEFAFIIDNEIYRGTGVGEMQGFTASPALVTQDKETGQAADTVVAANLSKMWTRMPSRLKGGSIFLYNSEVETSSLHTAQLAGPSVSRISAWEVHPVTALDLEDDVLDQQALLPLPAGPRPPTAGLQQ